MNLTESDIRKLYEHTNRLSRGRHFRDILVRRQPDKHIEYAKEIDKACDEIVAQLARYEESRASIRECIRSYKKRVITKIVTEMVNNKLGYEIYDDE